MKTHIHIGECLLLKHSILRSGVHLQLCSRLAIMQTFTKSFSVSYAIERPLMNFKHDSSVFHHLLFML